MGRIPLSTIHHTTTYVDRDITVNEYRAPTDASIAILREMEDKIKSNIIHREIIEDNIVNGVIIVFQVGTVMDEYQVRMRFTLNGHEYNIDERFRRFDVIQETHRVDLNAKVGTYFPGNQKIEIVIRKMFYQKASETLMKEFMTRCQIEGL